VRSDRCQGDNDQIDRVLRLDGDIYWSSMLLLMWRRKRQDEVVEVEPRRIFRWQERLLVKLASVHFDSADRVLVFRCEKR